jgi:hypothetical protein
VLGPAGEVQTRVGPRRYAEEEMSHVTPRS